LTGTAVRCPGTCIDGGPFCNFSAVVGLGLYVDEVVAGKIGVVAAEKLKEKLGESFGPRVE